MDAESALADLTEISSQVETAVVFEEGGAVLASTFADSPRGEGLARAGRDLFAAAAAELGGERRLEQLEVALRETSVFAVRDGRRTIVATTAAGVPSGLVLYDLRTCLRAIDDGDAASEAPARKASSRRKTTADA